MSESEREAPEFHERRIANAVGETARQEPHFVALRGPTPASIGPNSWLLAGLLGLVVLAAFIVVSFISAINANSAIDRMKAHGVPVTVTVGDCIGNIGGSGSNSAGFTCHGTYEVAGIAFHEIIGSMSAFSKSGTIVSGVADPNRHSTVELASAVRATSPSATAYIPSAVLAVLLGALILLLRRRARRPERQLP